MPTIFDKLRAEHERLRKTLAALSEPPPGSDPQELLFRLLREYTAYARAEEQVFYSYMIHIEGAQQRALQGLAEHQLIDSLLRQVEGAPPGDAHWESRVAALVASLGGHLAGESGDLLPLARRTLSEREAVLLGARFAAERARVHRDISSLDDAEAERAEVVE